MRRKVTLGPETISAQLGVLDGYISELTAHGVPGEAMVRIETTPDGQTITVNVEYEEEVEPLPAAAD